jgi:hypothetical protein
VNVVAHPENTTANNPSPNTLKYFMIPTPQCDAKAQYQFFKAQQPSKRWTLPAASFPGFCCTT